MKVGVGSSPGVNPAASFRLRHSLSEASAEVGMDLEVVRWSDNDPTAEGVLDALVWIVGPEHLARPTLPTSLPLAVLKGGRSVQELLDLNATFPDADVIIPSYNAAPQIVAWLSTQARDFSAVEHGMLEVLVADVRRALDEGRVVGSPEDRAQLRAAGETIEIQLRTPKKSRRVVKWALGQVASMPVGILSGIGATYLPELLHRFP